MINKTNLFLRENILVIFFVIVSIYFFNDYVNISAENVLPETDELGYLDEGIHLRDISYDFREIINRNRTPGLPLVVSFLAQNKGSLIQYSEEYIKLFKLITSVWTSAMNASAKLPENQFFVHTDFKFDNIVVCKNKKDELSFKLIDCESWTIVDGYHGVDTFYYSMFKMSLLMQRL